MTVTRYCDELWRRPFDLAQPPAELITVHDRKPDVEERDLRWVLPRHGECARTIVRDVDLVAELAQRFGEQERGVLVVVDHEHAERPDPGEYERAAVVAALRRPRVRVARKLD